METSPWTPTHIKCALYISNPKDFFSFAFFLSPHRGIDSSSWRSHRAHFWWAVLKWWNTNSICWGIGVYAKMLGNIYVYGCMCLSTVVALKSSWFSSFKYLARHPETWALPCRRENCTNCSEIWPHFHTTSSYLAKVLNETIKTCTILGF